MSRTSTRQRIKEAALKLFAQDGYARTSIGSIEKAAGLAPRAGAFYRHFDGKLALLEELAHEIAESPEEFEFEALVKFANTRAELISIAQTYEKAARRQAPYTRLINEVRLLDAGAALESEINDKLLRALMKWVSTKPAAENLPPQRLAALTVTIFGGWLFFLTKLQHGVEIQTLSSDTLLEDWATIWADFLDQTR